jgi:hypothetical protein
MPYMVYVYPVTQYAALASPRLNNSEHLGDYKAKRGLRISILKWERNNGASRLRLLSMDSMETTPKPVPLQAKALGWSAVTALMGAGALFLASCTGPQITGQGGDQAYHADKDIHYNIQYWLRDDHSIALLAVWDNKSSQYQQPFRWNGRQVDGRFQNVVIWSTLDAVAFSEADFPKPGHADLVYFDANGRSVIKMIDSHAAEDIYRDLTGSAR